MEHLKDSDILGYRRGTLDAAALLAADDHAAQCERCRQRLLGAAPTADPGAILGGLGEAHLTYEQIEGYVEDRPAAAERGSIESHLELCRQCRAEVEDLRTFRKVVDGGRKPVVAIEPRGGQRPRAWRWAAAAAAVLMGTFAAWWTASRLTPVPAVLHDGPASTASAADRDAMRLALSTGSFTVPGSLAALRGSGSLVRAPEGGASFALIEPKAEASISDRPRFRWQPAPGAVAYAVGVFTPDFVKVAESPWLSQTEWTPDKALPRGSIYSWQVTASMGVRPSSPTLRAPAVSDPEIQFEILPAEAAAGLERAAVEFGASHLLMGLLYARAGVLDAAEREFTALAAANPQSAQAATLLEKIRALRR